MKKLIFTSTLILVMSSCILDKVKERMDEGMMLGQNMLADHEFKKALAHIELHKLRTGNYPNSLVDLKFLSAMDSSMFGFIEYIRLDSGYELNLNIAFPSFNEAESKRIELQYPPEFWQGLGCIKSNVR